MSKSQQILQDHSVDFGQSQPSGYIESPGMARRDGNAIVLQGPVKIVQFEKGLRPPFVTDAIMRHVNWLKLLDVRFVRQGGKISKPVHGRRTAKFLLALADLAQAETPRQIKKADAKVAKARDALLTSMTPEVE